MEQANYNGGGFGRGRLWCWLAGGQLLGSFGRGVDSLAPPPGFPPHVASLRAAQYGVTHGCDPSGVPCSHLRVNGDAVCVTCDAASSLAADGNQRGEFAMTHVCV